MFFLKINKHLTKQFVKYTNVKRFYTIKIKPELDVSYLCNPLNTKHIEENICNRKGVGNIQLVNKLKVQLDAISGSNYNYERLEQEFISELLKLPNQTHPDVMCLEKEPRIVKYVGREKEFDFKPMEFYEISKKLRLVRTDHLGSVCGSRSYFLLGELAELEQALIRFTVDFLMKHNYKLVSVPDILNREIIEACGLNTRSDRTMVYSLDRTRHGEDLCLSGTSEMALAASLMDTTLNEEELPLKLASVSRCYRAETSSTNEERGIYRVHQFTKVEMFVVSAPEKSDLMLEEIRDVEEQLFGCLGLYLKILDMPPHELGAPAYRKYDIEGWMPGRNMFGEISSCSNCTDYQSRRLGIKYQSDGNIRHVHTLNGTACAIPRMLIALCETYQMKNGKIYIPELLRKYMNGKEFITRQKTVPELNLIKNKR